MLVLFIACGNNNSLNPANPVEVEEIKITEEPQNNAKDSNNNDENDHDDDENDHDDDENDHDDDENDHDDDENDHDDDENDHDDDENDSTSKQKDEFEEFVGFTHTPVDFEKLFSEDSVCRTYPSIQPYFNHFVVNHTEGPKKWYLATCSKEPIKVFLPVKSILDKRSIRIYSDRKSTINEEEVLFDAQIWMRVSEDVTVFFMHLALLDKIKSLVEKSETEEIVLEAGTHIGYIKTDWDFIDGNNSNNRPEEYHVIDFGVEDRSFDADLTEIKTHWWNVRANPLDYFTEELKNSILSQYQPVYQKMVDEGTHPFTNLEDSRPNINEIGKIWGTWFKDDITDAFDQNFGSEWSIIHLTKTADLSKETFWEILDQNPDISGILIESKMNKLIGKPLYNDSPVGQNKFFIVSGDDSVGIGKKSNYFNDNEFLYVKYQVKSNSKNQLDDILTLEVFKKQDFDEYTNFSNKAVTFRRGPIKR